MVCLSQSSLISSNLSKRRSELWPSTHISLPKRVTLAKSLNKSSSHLLLASGGGNNNGRDGNNNNNDGSWWRWHHDDDSDPAGPLLLFMSSLLCCFCQMSMARALAISEDGTVWEVKGSKWRRLIPDFSNDTYIFARNSSLSSLLSLEGLWNHCRDMIIRLMLPQGYPDSVTNDYLDYSLWRGVQGVASQVSGVLATQVIYPFLLMTNAKLVVVLL